MKLVGLNVNCCQFFIGYLDALCVGTGIQGCFDVQAGRRLRVTYEIDDHSAAEQRPAAPILRDMAKHPMFDLVGTGQQNRASFEREGGATCASGRGLERGARTRSAVHRAVFFAWSGGNVRMWREAGNTGRMRVRERVGRRWRLPVGPPSKWLAQTRVLSTTGCPLAQSKLVK